MSNPNDDRVGAAMLVASRQFERDVLFTDLTDDEIRTLARAAIAAMGGWRDDMENAPRGEVIWLFEPHDAGGFMFAGVIPHEGKCYNNLDLQDQNPTHWQPLPPPPEPTT